MLISIALPQETVKVMTFNLQGMKPGTNHETRLINIIEKLKEIDPDIIGLQEINESLNSKGNDNQAKVIADSLSVFFGIPYHYYISFTHLSWDNQFREYVGIITKYPVEEEGFFQLGQGVFPRKVVWNSIITPLGKINFFNTHLSFNSADVRAIQVQQIISYIQNTESSNPAVASLLTGDFNDTPNSASIQLLINSGTDTSFVSTFGEANPGDPGFTMPSNSPSNKIDYVFYKKTGNLKIDSSYIVMNQPFSGNNFCSDHFAVLTIFEKCVVNDDKEMNLLPYKFKLFQNYPNLFNPPTIIKFTILSLPTGQTGSPLPKASFLENPLPFQGEG